MAQSFLGETSGASTRTRRLALAHTSTVAVWILVLSLILTAIAWFLSHRYIKERAKDRFDFRSNEVIDSIKQRMTAYEQVLRGAVGLFQSSDHVSREEWKSYINNTALDEYYPGIQGVGVAEMVSAAEREAFVESVREEGFPEFDIKPAGERDPYSAIIYLEPFDWRNQRAFGYDMYSEPDRHAAMDRAIDTGNPTLSKMVTLVQETQSDVQKGFLVYLPLYHKSMPTETIQQRREAALRFVYAPFRANDLMRGILQRKSADVDFEIYDGDSISEETLLYDSNARIHLDPDHEQGQFSATRDIQLNGRKWRIYFESQPGFVSTAESYLSFMVACGGLLVDALLFLFISATSRQQRSDSQRAEGMTNAFKLKQQQFQAVCDTAHDPIVLVDAGRKILYCNPATERIFGYAEEELLQSPMRTLFLSDAAADSCFDNRIDSSVERSADVDDLSSKYSKCLKKNGASFFVDVSVSNWRTDMDEFAAVVLRDVTEEKRTNELIQQQILELERSNRDLDDFAYVASHDLRSPLRNIDSLATWVTEDSVDLLPESSREHLDSLRARIKKMEMLLDDLLQYSRAGRIRDKLSNFDTRQLVTSIATMLSKPAQFQIVADKSLPTMTTLKTPLETCLRNLINNAIKHHDRSDGTVTISATGDVRFVYFTVADDGPGIDPRFQDRIFKIFQTLVANNDGPGGSGIGLAVVKKTVATYGGTVKVESEPGKGARFTLKWPRNIQVQELT